MGAAEHVERLGIGGTARGEPIERACRRIGPAACHLEGGEHLRPARVLRPARDVAAGRILGEIGLAEALLDGGEQQKPIGEVHEATAEALEDRVGAGCHSWARTCSIARQEQRGGRAGCRAQRRLDIAQRVGVRPSRM